MKSDWYKTISKVKFVGLTSLSVLLYAFVIFLIFGFDGGSSFWISFAFAVVGIVLAYYISYFSIRAAKRLFDWIFSLPVMRWCVIYVTVEIILSTIYMIFPAPWKLVFLSQFFLPIFFLVLVVPCFAQKKHIATVKEETAVKVSYIRLLHSKLMALLPRTEDANVKKELEKATELLRHSDPMSAESLKETEQKLSEYVGQLDSLIRAANWSDAFPIAKEICFLIEERNQLVIASKLTQY